MRLRRVFSSLVDDAIELVTHENHRPPEATQRPIIVGVGAEVAHTLILQADLAEVVAEFFKLRL
jgi:hypothetical protein